jgi:YidC/Oxa1 family membrane protein insertase
MTEQQIIQPEMAKIQEKYAGDRQKIALEQQKLFKEHKINPLAGCLPMLIQLPIMFAIYWIVSEPLYWILNWDAGQVTALHEQLTALGAAVPAAARGAQVQLLNLAMQYGVEGIPHINYDLFGLNVGLSPSEAIKPLFSLSAYWLIPILAAATGWISQKLTMVMAEKRQKNQKEALAAKIKDKEKLEEELAKKPAADAMGAQMKTTMTVMPLVTGLFTFSFSSAIGIYWIINNVTQMLQQLYVNWRMEKYHADKTKDPLAGMHPNQKKKLNKANNTKR